MPHEVLTPVNFPGNPGTDTEAMQPAGLCSTLQDEEQKLSEISVIFQTESGSFIPQENVILLLLYQYY